MVRRPGPDRPADAATHAEDRSATSGVPALPDLPPYADALPHATLLVVDADLVIRVLRGGGLVDDGVDDARLEGLRFDQALPAAYVARMLPLLERALAGDEADDEAWSLDGRRRYLLRSGPLRDAVGTVVGAVGLATDVTSYVDDARRSRLLAERFRLLAENSNDVVVRVDLDGTVLWVSPSVRSVLGHDPADVVGRHVLGLVDPSEHERVMAVVREQIGLGETERLVVRFPTREGGMRELSGTAKVVRDDDGGVTGAVLGLRDVTEEQQVRRELAYRATHDALTGVANRREMHQALAQRLRVTVPPPRVGVLYCDVDRLKQVNDTLGHMAGDAVLRSVADRLVSTLRDGDVVARVGGDEFVVILESVRDEAALTAIAEKCRAAVEGEVTLTSGDGVRSVPVTVSVGGAVAGADEDVDALLGRADAALRGAKDGGRDRVVTSAPGAGPRE